MAARSVVDGVLQLASAASNAYILDGGEGLILVDTGMARRADEMTREIDRASRGVARDLAAIVITHAHADHIGSLGRLAGTYRVPIVAGTLDADIIRRGGRLPSPTPTGPLGRLLMPFSRAIPVEPARVDVAVDDGDHVPGAPALRALHTPGHTPGHTSYLWAEAGGVLFAGDVCINLLGLRESLVHTDREAAAASLARLAALDFEVAVFGHGPPITRRAVTKVRKLVEQQAAQAARATAR